MGEYEDMQRGGWMALYVGDNLRRVRERIGITQTDLARRMETRPSWVSLLERSTDLPTPETVERLARALGVVPAELLEGVITPWDVLRGATAPTAAVQPGQHHRDVAALLKAYEALNEGNRRVVLQVARRLR